MTLHRRIVVWSAVVVCAVSELAVAQATTSEDAHRWAGGVAADIGGVPDELSTQCGDQSGGVPMIGGGFSLLFHARPWLVFSTDTRASLPMPAGCKTFIPAPVQVGANQWTGAASRDLGGLPTAPLLRSALHLGVETTRGRPLVRATAGGGWLWAARPVPYATATIGVGSRGKVVRFYTELEASVARVRVNETQTFYHFDATNGMVIDAQRTTRVVLHPQWGAVHIGVELPRGSP